MSEKKYVQVEEAVGKVLMHDITEIVPGKFKGPAFKKGDVIKKSDIKKLKRLGKDKIYIYRIPEDHYHENEAGELFKKLAGENVIATGPSEGKVVFSAETDGMLTVDKSLVNRVNKIEQVAFATLHSDQPVKQKEEFAGIRIIPLSISRNIIDRMMEDIGQVPLAVKSFGEKKVGLIITGNEVAAGRIEDKFRPVIEKKISEYNSTIKEFSIIEDDPEKLKEKILNTASSGCDFIILTGGMSVDPDDITEKAIREAGVEVVSYGAPVLPGNMFMAGYKGDIPVFGVPACALFYERTVLDLFLPYVFSDTRITRRDIIKKGYGGFCRHCENCDYPECSFGKC